MEQVTDHEFSYFLGLCVIRGEMSSDRMLIRFRYITPTIKLPPDSDVALSRKSREYVIDVTQLREHLGTFFETQITAEQTASDFSITVPMREGSLAHKILVGILGTRNFSFKQSRIPAAILNASNDIKRTFLMGVADACSCPTYSDRDQFLRCRVCLDIPFENWFLPNELCKMMQEDLDVRVDGILWGHPNVRTPKSPNARAWAKEHRIRIYATEFQKIGFRFEFKNEILEEFVKWNQRNKMPLKYCWANKGRARNKPTHTGENDARIPEGQRRHFNSFREICVSLGCCQQEKS